MTGKTRRTQLRRRRRTNKRGGKTFSQRAISGAKSLRNFISSSSNSLKANAMSNEGKLSVSQFKS